MKERSKGRREGGKDGGEREDQGRENEIKCKK